MTDVLLALLGLGLFSAWLSVQIALNRRLRRWIASGEGYGALRLRPVQVGPNRLLTLGQLRRLLQQIRQLLHLAVVLLVAYVVLPFPLNRLPATHALSVRWQNQLQGLLVQLAAVLRDILPDLLVIGRSWWPPRLCCAASTPGSRRWSRAACGSTGSIPNGRGPLRGWRAWRCW
jgi:hypothetical protein